MTTVLVASDTHGDLSFVRRALEAHPEAEALLHLGDTCEDAQRLAFLCGRPLHGVRGNGDFGCRHGCPDEDVAEVGGRRLLLTHGHFHRVKDGLSALTAHALARRPAVDAVLFGHTHRPLQRTVPRKGAPPLLLLNPGSARTQALHGVAAPSLALLRIGPGAGAEGLEVVWLDPVSLASPSPR